MSSTARPPKKFSPSEHLSTEAIAAFIDGELSPLAMHRARVHLIHCHNCAEEVRVQREAVQRLKESEAETPSIPEALVERLTKIADWCPAGPGVDGADRARPQSFLDKMDLLYHAVRRTRKND
ncbi:MAG: anti-sigma factor [Corynebacterium sp.]|nr:anti-sigma factor [Corynebacterium sp.]